MEGKRILCFPFFVSNIDCNLWYSFKYIAMPKINVRRTIIINKPIEVVFKEVNNFNNWKDWSPWLRLETEADVIIEPHGKQYKWNGQIIGSGEMKIEKEVENVSVHCDLTFLTPFKSKAKTNIYFNKVEEGTEVSWTMDSSLPFFMFWMKNSMENFIGMDYDRGLKMLKDKAEKGAVPSHLEINGSVNFEGGKYVAIKRECKMNQMFEKMPSDFSKLMPKAHQEWKALMNGNPFSIYHKWDLKNKTVAYSACFPISEFPEDLPSEFSTGVYPSSKMYKVTHTGAMDHISNAWSAQMMRMRNKVFKGNKRVHPIEVYLNSPMDTPTDELKAEILFGMK